MSEQTHRLCLLALLLIVGLVGCRGHPVAGELNTPLELDFNRFRELESEKLRLAFLEVEADSRCPLDAQCITAGQAELLVRVLQDGARLEDLIITVGDAAPLPSYIVGDYAIDVLDLQPPEPSERKADYQLLIEVRRTN